MSFDSHHTHSPLFVPLIQTQNARSNDLVYKCLTEALLDQLPSAKCLLADRGYDAEWFRKGLRSKGITPCIPPRKTCRNPTPYDKTLYKQRHKIENMFGKLKDWRRIANRYDRCAHTFLAAITIAAIVIWYL